MPKFQLYLDGNCLSFAKNDNEINEQIALLLDIFREFKRHAAGVVVSENYWEMLVGIRGRVLSDFIYGKTAFGLNEDTLRELRVYFDRCMVRQTDPMSIAYEIKGESFEHESTIHRVAFDEFNNNQTIPVILTDLGNKRSGEVVINAENTSVIGYIFCAVEQMKDLLVTAFKVFPPEREDFVTVASATFENIIFHPELALEDLGVPLKNFIDIIVSHLLFLNNDFLRIANDLSWDIHNIVVFSKGLGITFSDESDGTKRDRKKIAQRVCSFLIDGKNMDFRCTLHTKITYNVGRIHFHGPCEAYPGKILVGKFHAHLDV